MNIPNGAREPIAGPQGMMNPSWYRFLFQFFGAFQKLANATNDPTLYTVGTLPSASSQGAGVRLFVTDATATTFASVPIGGGVNGVPVYSDGNSWRIG